MVQIVASSGVALALPLARVINYTPRVMFQIVASFTDDSKGIIYDCIMFTVQAKGLGLNNTEASDIFFRALKVWGWSQSSPSRVHQDFPDLLLLPNHVVQV